MRVEIISDVNGFELERSINRYIKDKKVKDIKFTACHSVLYAMIIYEKC